MKRDIFEKVYILVYNFLKVNRYYSPPSVFLHAFDSLKLTPQELDSP